MVDNLDRAANISDWIEPYLAPTPNVTQFRQFKLEMIQGRVCVSARSRCAEEAEFNPWTSLEQTPGHTAVSLCHCFAVSLLLFKNNNIYIYVYIDPNFFRSSNILYQKI